MTCKKYIKLLIQYTDKELSGALLQEVEEHLEQCECCKTIFHTYSQTIVLTRKAEPSSKLSPATKKKLKELIHAKLEGKISK
jgi:predicted anti-sigma-YlaC factor YlaD